MVDLLVLIKKTNLNVLLDFQFWIFKPTWRERVIIQILPILSFHTIYYIC